MNNRHFTALELDKILLLLAGEATSPVSAQRILKIEPFNTYRDVADAVRQTADINSLTSRYGTPSLAGMPDSSDFIRKSKIGARLSTAELLCIGRLLRNIREMKRWRGQGSEETSVDFLFECLQPLAGLENDISSAILSEDELADSASPELQNIRRKIARAQISVRDKLDGIIRSPQYSRILQEPIVTLRDGRFVVPVKAECKGEMKGLVHDTSSSGATVFIEPLAVIEANNEIRILQNEERAEIDRILSEFSARVGDCSDSILGSFEALIDIDILLSKSRLADKQKATVPEINPERIINLKKARHPLIDKDKVVPVDITLGDGFDTLVVTGPNTGGKTVVLKTIGLFSLMAACGMMIPASSGSTLPVFSHVLADIGDEQSIEQSLSTFSSHIKNIISILEIADEQSLVLTDELGAGTDPVEGAALAVAIIEAFRAKGCTLAATTHYAEIKMYALQTEGVENGCCEFDVATLSPTYRLLIGVPGRSNAFAISSRLGLSSDVIERAQELVSTENTRFEDVVSSLEQSRQELEEAKAKAQKAFEEAEQLKLEAQKRAQEHEEQLSRELNKARENAQSLVERVRSQTDLLLNELEELKKQKDKEDFSARVAQERQHYRGRIDKLRDMADPISQRRTENYTPPRPIKSGDTVIITDIGTEGVVISGPDSSGNYLVQAGIMKTKVSGTSLRLTEKPVKKQPLAGRSVNIKTDRAKREVRTELDIRGLASDEAIIELNNFIDRCIVAGIKNVTIIHGKGTGVLRKAVMQRLRTHSAIKSQRPGLYGEGEMGVTIAELK